MVTRQTLYSLRTHLTADGDRYFITKFVDGEVESAYACTPIECECPAGVRPSCRHRQMLPQMLAHGLVNTHWFWDFDRGYACDFQGGSKRLADQLVAGLAEEETAEDAPAVGEALTAAPTPASKPSWRRM